MGSVAGDELQKSWLPFIGDIKSKKWTLPSHLSSRSAHSVKLKSYFP